MAEHTTTERRPQGVSVHDWQHALIERRRAEWQDGEPGRPRHVVRELVKQAHWTLADHLRQFHTTAGPEMQRAFRSADYALMATVHNQLHEGDQHTLGAPDPRPPLPDPLPSPVDAELFRTLRHHAYHEHEPQGRQGYDDGRAELADQTSHGANIAEARTINAWRAGQTRRAAYWAGYHLAVDPTEPI